MELTEAEKETALRYYLSHKKSMKEYQQRNKEKMKEYNKEYLDKLNSDPEKRKLYLEKKKMYYTNVTKSKLEAQKAVTIVVE
jgi:hypothetical protein